MDDLISRQHFEERVRLAGGMADEELTQDFKDGVLTVLELLKTEPPVTAAVWTPITTRPLTDEEKEEYILDGIEFMFTCPMPDDGQEVIVSTKWGSVNIDTFCRDVEGSYFESYDIDEVTAWMPLPEPWKVDAE